ncbi:MAG: hypothetical protein OHK0015_30480 [Chloroflexi bacterium OHK40]
MHMIRHVLLLALVAGIALFTPAPLAAQLGERCFPETGFCISGPIRAYWERNGGLPVFGYPIGPQREELAEGRAIQVQWFERDRLEIQADGTLTAGRLGARYLELTGRPWSFNEAGNPPAIGPCRTFPQTGYQVCGMLLEYWQANGGIERFGYPLTNLMSERLGDREYQVQYFERRRMEYHPEHAGTPYVVQLGLLGHAIATAAVCPQAVTAPLRAAVRHYLAVMGCPIDPGRSGAVAWQRYERGAMYWVAASSSASPMIFVVINDDAAQRTTWLARNDTYREGEPVGGTVPPGQIGPLRGFGKLWWGEDDIQRALGWPIEPEQGGSGAALAFNSGGWIFQRDQPDLIVVMQPDGTAFGVRSSLLPQ